MRSLSPRELAIVEQVKQGSTGKQIALALDLPEAAVHVHLRRLVRASADLKGPPSVHPR
jgi:DNA-binding NarL/FixJ family response regulator